MPYCSNCGAENPQEASFCASCDSPMSAIPTDDVLIARDIGGLISETFGVYRRHFWPFVIIVLLAEIPLVVASLTDRKVLSVILTLVSVFLGILAYGAIIYGVASQYLGRGVRVGECYERAWRRIISLVVGSILVAIVLLLLFLLSFLIIGIPVFFYILVVWFFFPQAIMLERMSVFSAFGRSSEWVKGSWWRVFGIGVVFVLVIIGLSVVASIPGVIAGLFSEPVGDSVGAVAGIFVTPIVNIGATLVYLDLRVRKERYTLKTMASELGLEEVSYLGETGL